MGIGDWGLGIGDWGLGVGTDTQSTMPKPHTKKLNNLKKKKY